jgi:septal ring factor EnvC (AmiA/AmiB activator)
MKGFRKEYRLRTTYRHWVIGSAFFFMAAVFGCAKVPPCTVSPVEIEETREDVKILEKDLVSAKERAKQLSDELAKKKAELDSKKEKPGELRKKLDELEKGSGRHESQKKDKDKDEEETA